MATRIDDMIRGDHENYKEYLQLKEKRLYNLNQKKI